mgnify:CR=1 FL=1
MMKTVELRKSRDFGDIISDTFKYIRVHFKTLGKGLFLFVFPVVIISGVLVSSSFMSVMDFENFANPEAVDANALAHQTGAFMGKFLLGMLLFMLNFFLIYVIVFKHMKLVDSGVTDITPNMLVEDLPRNFFGIVVIMFVTGIATAIVFLFLIMPGIAMKFSLAPAIYIIEEENFSDALSRSWNTTKDYWWLTFGMNFVMSIIMNFTSYIFIIPMYFVIGIVTFASGGDGSKESIGFLISILYGLSIVIPALLYCIPIASQAFVYFNIHERKTGRSMLERIESLEDI